MQIVEVKDIEIGLGAPLVLIAGPCVIESERLCLETAKRIKELCEELGFPYIFKSSFDKANRLSHESFRGPGIDKGLEILNKVKQKLKLLVLSDVHCVEQIDKVKDVLDVIQIPALLCRQTDLLIEAGKTQKPINLKKGQFLAPWDMHPLIKKIESTGNKKILITERGTSFGYNNLVVDFRSLLILQELGYPVIFDATHSVQIPGGRGRCSSGERKFVPGLCRAGVAFGCQGLFLEVHPYPDKALCDGPNMVDLKTLRIILKEAKRIKTALEDTNEKSK